MGDAGPGSSPAADTDGDGRGGRAGNGTAGGGGDTEGEDSGPGAPAEDDDTPGSEDDDFPPDDDVPSDDILPPECGIPATTQFPRLLNREYDAIIRDLLDVTSLAAAGGGPPSALLAADHEGALTEASWSAYLTTAETIAMEVIAGPNANRFIDCDPASAECLRQTITTFGRKAFRRPLTEAEVERFMALTVEPPGTPTEVAETLLFAFLSSPHFLTVPELDETADAETGATALSQHELAARLALLLWGSIPDDELNRAADAGELGSAEGLREQALRMAAVRDKVGPQLIGAHRAYAKISPGTYWARIDHDPARFPAFSSLEEVGPPMMAELDAFFEAVAFEGTFGDLFTSNLGFVNRATAPLYDLNAEDYDTALSPVEFPEGERPGFLTRVGFLSSFSHYDSTAPMLRGAYVEAWVLGVDPGPPPPGLTATPRPDGEFRTNRERSEVQTSEAECRACHVLLNPPGYVLEVYDAVGRVQTVDPLGGPIDPTADVTFALDDVRTITSPEQLMAQIAASPSARRLYAERLLSYLTKRAPNPEDACLVEALYQRLHDDTFPLRGALVELSQADSFRLRVRAE